MAVAWEYAQLVLKRDPGEQGSPITGWLKLPGQDEPTKLKVTDSLKFLNRLGSEGWEMIAPTTQNAVFSYKSRGQPHDRAYWVERVFWLKRQASE